MKGRETVKQYYYQIAVYDHKRKRWIKKHGCGIFNNELIIGHEYEVVRYGIIRPIKLKAIYDDGDLIYENERT